jgi:hypothetical protein
MQWKIGKNRQRFNDRGRSRAEFKDGEQFLTHSLWDLWIRIFPVKENGLLEAIEICCAIWAVFEMTHDLAASAGTEF